MPTHVPPFSGQMLRTPVKIHSLCPVTTQCSNRLVSSAACKQLLVVLFFSEDTPTYGFLHSLFYLALCHYNEIPEVVNL
jgi:hypothetical protein